MARKLNISRRLHPDDATAVYLIVQHLMKENYNGVTDVIVIVIVIGGKQLRRSPRVRESFVYKPQNGKVVCGPANERHMTKEQ